MNWEFLIDEESLSQLLPRDYFQFALPFKQSLAVFLSHLPDTIQEQILAEQLNLPADASLSERLGKLAHACPVLHKIGQILARDQRLAPELRAELHKLESLPSAVPVEVIESTLIHELGSLESKALQLLPPAIAEASVAVIVPYKDLSRPGQPEGVFKVLKPGIENRLNIELEILSKIGEYLDNRLSELGIPLLNYKDTFDQVRNKLSWELRLDQEQRNLRYALKFYSNEPRIQIPALFEHCTSRITAMERVYGEKITDHRFKLSIEKDRLAELTARALITHPILSSDDQALFHCDPHAGNLFSTHDGRVAILDWSLAGYLGVNERTAIVQIMLAALSMRPDRMVDLLRQLDTKGQFNTASLRACVDRWLRKLRTGTFAGLSWLVGLLDEAVQVAQLSLTVDLLMFRKSLLTLTGVLSEIGAANFNLDHLLLREFLTQSVWEWPTRLVSDPWSRLFSTRLSNADIAELLLSSPIILSRYWQALLIDSMNLQSEPTMS